MDPSAIVAAISLFVCINLTAAFAPVAVFDGNLLPAVFLGGLAGFFAITIPLQRQIGFSLAETRMRDPRLLVTTGAFAYTRNPIYCAFFVPLIAYALMSPLAAAMSIAFYIVLMNRVVVRREEGELRRFYGADFDAYAQRVPRWLVRLPWPCACQRDGQSVPSA
jgi:protein-S-isoprenylcysteine O-methyltransferase Ste14